MSALPQRPPRRSSSAVSLFLVRCVAATNLSVLGLTCSAPVAVCPSLRHRVRILRACRLSPPFARQAEPAAVVGGRRVKAANAPEAAKRMKRRARKYPFAASPRHDAVPLASNVPTSPAPPSPPHCSVLRLPRPYRHPVPIVTPHRRQWPLYALPSLAHRRSLCAATRRAVVALHYILRTRLCNLCPFIACRRLN
jgi:hypothetical protein